MQFACNVVWWKEYWASYYVVFFCEFDTQLQVLIEIVLKYCKSTNSGRKILLDCENCFLFSCLLYKMEAKRRQFVFETSMNACNVMSSLGLFLTSEKQCFLPSSVGNSQWCCNSYETIWRKLFISFHLC